LWIRRKWSGRSIAPAQWAIRVTTGVARTQPIKETANINRKAFEIIMEAAILIVQIRRPSPGGVKATTDAYPGWVVGIGTRVGR
jgi:hypothetical protein